MSWYRLSLGDALLAEGELPGVVSRYAADPAVARTDAAIFSRHEAEGRMHCELVLYLSPALSVLARTLGASACAPPARAGLGLVAGDGAAWALLFEAEARPQAITGFHQDEEGHWVADLACGHGQHVRHNPPWNNRPWVLTAEGRAAQLGQILMCRKCVID